MTRVRTFIDSGLLILAARGNEPLSQLAMEILDDPTREFVSSDFVRLEVCPKAVYNRQAFELQFYEEFFQAVTTVPTSPDLVTRAFAEAVQFGLSAVDALHIAAAKEGGCSVFETAEKPTKPLFRVTGINVASLRQPT